MEKEKKRGKQGNWEEGRVGGGEGISVSRTLV